jgi:mono/diheme cytochrome c family protein
MQRCRFDGLDALGLPTVLAILLALLATLALAACERPPAADSLAEWTPADHHSTDEEKLAAGAQQKPAATGGDVTSLVDLTWRQQCSTCHGAAGKGDGQMAQMLKVPDLTVEAWQATVSDTEIAATIKGGKGKMPSFNVPDSVIQGLVARVRAARGR